MIIAIPSKGRPNLVRSLSAIPSAVIYCPENERDAYSRCNPRTKVVGVPSQIIGITKTRNWILDNTPSPRVVFIDDDLKKCGWSEATETRFIGKRLTEPQWLDEFMKLFDITEQMGLRIFGLDTLGEPRAIYTYKPFVFHTYVTASCMGILNRGSNRARFDETFPVKEDYELTLRCIKEDGAVLGARYLYWANYHWAQPGGCRDYRTQAMEYAAILRLKHMYPGMISRVIKGGSSYSIRLDF